MSQSDGTGVRDGMAERSWMGLKLLITSILVVPSVLCQAPPAAAAKPAPDVLIFTNGDQLTGKLERGVGDSLVFHSDMAGELTIPLARIKELHTSENFALLRKDTKTFTTNVQIGTISYADGTLDVTDSAGVEKVPPAQVGFVVDQATYEKQLKAKPGPLTGWSGSITGGATIVRATQYGSTYTLSTNLTRTIPTVAYLPPRNRTLFALAETYGTLNQPAVAATNTAASQIKTSIFHSSIERDEYLSPRFYILGNATFDHNFALGLQFQQVYGGGFGYTVLKSPNQELDLSAELDYQKQSFFVSTNNQNLIGATLGETYNRKLLKGIALNESANILPAFNNANAYSGNGMVGLTLPVYKRLAVSTSVTDNFLNQPQPGYNKNSFQFVTGVTYTLP